MNKFPIKISHSEEIELRSFIKQKIQVQTLAKRLNIDRRSLSTVLKDCNNMKISRLKDILAAIGYKLTLHIEPD